jgi:hypothetical protein
MDSELIRVLCDADFRTRLLQITPDSFNFITMESCELLYELMYKKGDR